MSTASSKHQSSASTEVRSAKRSRRRKEEQTLLMRPATAGTSPWGLSCGCGLVAEMKARAYSWRSLGVSFCRTIRALSLKPRLVSTTERLRDDVRLTSHSRRPDVFAEANDVPLRCQESPDSDLSTPFPSFPRGDVRFIYFHLQRRCLRQFSFRLPKFRDAFGPTLVHSSKTLPFLRSFFHSVEGMCITFHLAFCT